jgi:ribulose-phosphate 3-epimerase
MNKAAAMGKPRGKNSAPPRGEHVVKKEEKKQAESKAGGNNQPVRPLTRETIEIVPAILRATFEEIETDWKKVQHEAEHIQIDVTDGVFAGKGTFRELGRFKQLPGSEKIELHMMVHTPANFLPEIVDLAPARCIFHLESFTGTDGVVPVYEKLRKETHSELALALNPESPNERLEEFLGLIDYVLFMGYTPGFANQPIDEVVFRKVGQWHDKHPEMAIAVDGHVNQETVRAYCQAGATILCSNTAIFGQGEAAANLRNLEKLCQEK